MHFVLSWENQYDKLSLLTHLSMFPQLRNVAKQQIRRRFSERLHLSKTQSDDHSGQMTFTNPILTH